ASLSVPGSGGARAGGGADQSAQGKTLRKRPFKLRAQAGGPGRRIVLRLPAAFTFREDWRDIASSLRFRLELASRTSGCRFDPPVRSKVRGQMPLSHEDESARLNSPRHVDPVEIHARRQLLALVT